MTKFYRYLFTRSELRGVLLLSSAVILIRILSFSMAPFDPEPEGEQYSEEPVESLRGTRGKPGEKMAKASVPESSGQEGKKKKSIEINSADSLSLLDLPGIGPVFAKRILSYRRMLGGFVNPEQLFEVYGMDSVRLSGFINLIRIDTTLIRKLDINQATFKELLAHPYLEYEQVKAIARFRDRKGRLGSPGELWAAGVLADSIWQRLSHYLVTGSDSDLKEDKILVK